MAFSSLSSVGSKITGAMKDNLDSLQKKVKDGDVQAQLQLASLYESGKKGISKNYDEAIKLYKAAAQKGNAIACYSLGVLYKNGEGDHKKDLSESKKWFEKAKDLGFEKANGALNLLTLGGQGFQNRLLGGADEKKQTHASVNSPVDSVSKTPLLSLSEACKPLHSVFEDIDTYVALSYETAEKKKIKGREQTRINKG